jgi:hypothetical protein
MERTYECVDVEEAYALQVAEDLGLDVRIVREELDRLPMTVDDMRASYRAGDDPPVSTDEP